jgi:hypothetical protein
MRIRIAATMALAVAATAGATAFTTPHASALVSPVRITEVCVNGGPSNHVWVDESFGGLAPGGQYQVDINRGTVAFGNELGWNADGAGNHVARTLFEITGTDTIARAGQTFHWVLKQGSSHLPTGTEGDAVVLSGSCTLPPAPDTKITLAKIMPARHKAKFAFSGVGATTRFQCKLKKAHHTASFTSCTSPRVYRHLSRGKYTFFVRATGPGGTDASPARFPFRI